MASTKVKVMRWCQKWEGGAGVERDYSSAIQVLWVGAIHGTIC